MLVKCCDTNEKKPKEECYKAPDGKYYTSEKAYNIVKKSKEDWLECIDNISTILGYHKGMKFPTTLPKRLKQLEGYGYDVVLETLMQNYKEISWSLVRRQFNSEYGRIAYVFGIIEHNILPVYNKKQHYEKALENMSTKTIENMDLSNIGNHKTSHDVSKLLGDID